MAVDRIRIRLKAYDHAALDRSVDEIVQTVRRSGARIAGPVPLPTRRTIYTVLRGPFVDKKSREQFETRVHKRLIDIYDSTPQTVDSLMKLDLPAGIGIHTRVAEIARRRHSGCPRARLRVFLFLPLQRTCMSYQNFIYLTLVR
ncbi:MAG TPA: 30S ribosomal protein S10 [Candidatus Handelsmanbacteria bacterium]|nr:30S ribosomal protein S10 [Candidatus Handelsmanbacteria bacterium]